MGHFGQLFTKISSTSIAPKIEAFTTNKVVHICFHLAHIKIIQAHTFGQKIWNELWKNILGAYFLHVGPPYV
jgi:hypothetical protein